MLDELIKKIVSDAIAKNGIITVYEDDDLLDEITAEIYRTDPIATYNQVEDLVIEEVYNRYSQSAS